MEIFNPHRNSVPEEIPEMQNTELKGESAIKFVEEIGNKVIHHYNIYNYGTWNITNLRVEFEWPYQVANDKVQGKWLLYLDEPPVIESTISVYHFRYLEHCFDTKEHCCAV